MAASHSDRGWAKKPRVRPGQHQLGTAAVTHHHHWHHWQSWDGHVSTCSLHTSSVALSSASSSLRRLSANTYVYIYIYIYYSNFRKVIIQSFRYRVFLKHSVYTSFHLERSTSHYIANANIVLHFFNELHSNWVLRKTAKYH